MTDCPARSKPALGAISRRRLLKQTAAAAVAAAFRQPLRALETGDTSRRQFAYAGTYTGPMDGAAGNGKGIYLYEVNQRTGELNFLDLAAEARNPSWLAFHPSGRYLYAVNEVMDYEGNSGAVTAFSVNHRTGRLQVVSMTNSGGAGPAHLSVDSAGKYVFVANYWGGTIAVLPVLSTGGLGSATYVHRDEGSTGSKIPSDAPAGTFSFSGHDKPHAHMIQADPGTHFILQSDLGQDRIYIYHLNSESGELTPSATAPFVALPSGDGPRHFTFHPNGRWFYSLQEEGSTVAFFLFDPVRGFLQLQQTLSTLPPGFRGTNFTSEIVLSADARFLYVANRLHDSIAIFAIGHDGQLQYKGEFPTLGDYPRFIGVGPGGDFLYACNQRSDSITCFRLERESGQITPTGLYTAIGTPSCIVFSK